MKNKQYEKKEVYKNTLDENKYSTEYIYSRNEVTYLNAISGKKQAQNYIHMNDIIVPIILKINDGVIYFAVQYKYIPACNKIFLELPAYSVLSQDNKEEYELFTNKDIEYTINKTLEEKNLKRIYLKELSSNFEPVSQSFTDQMIKYVEIEVQNTNNIDNLNWYPINTINDLINRNDINMSIQTKYGLLLFSEKYKKEIEKIKPTKFHENKKIINEKFNNEDKEQKKVFEIYRFGIVEKYKIDKKILDLFKNNTIESVGSQIVYATSKDSVQCILTKLENNKIMVGLSKQQRSPFIPRQDVDEFFYENPAGLVEKGEIFEVAAKREALEETGIQINGKMHQLSSKLLFSYGTEEMTEVYLAELKDKFVQSKQELDEDESISSLEWFNLKTLDIDKLHAPIATKISLIMTKRFYNN